MKHVLKKPDLAIRVVTLAFELSKYDISFVSMSKIKFQALKNFMAEFSIPVEGWTSYIWTLSVDGSLNLKGRDIRFMLKGPIKMLLEKSSCFSFKTNNKQVEYEALIA